MSAMSTSKGWVIFLSALFKTRFWSVSAAAEAMFRLNVTARNLRRHPITDQIYELKNRLIKYLYQHGYCTEVKLHSQKRVCHACGGDGIYWNGEDCYKCDGTGVYAVTQLYAFRFDVYGKRYAWHQLKKLVDYPITLNLGEPAAPFVEPTLKEDLALKMDEAWLGCCLVYWFLRLHGVKADLLLFSRTRLDILWSWRMRISPIKQWWSRLRSSLKRGSADQLVVVPDDDDIPF